MPPALQTLPPAAWPDAAAWMRGNPSFSGLQRRIVERALRDDGILEVPLGSNRSPYLDTLIRWAGLDPSTPGGVYWCAIWAARVFVDAGARVPERFPSCDSWLPYLVPLDRVAPSQRVGAAILYGVPGDAKHIGIVARVHPELTLTIEGNRGYAGTSTNNGVAVDLAPLTRRDVLGLVLPVPVSSPS